MLTAQKTLDTELFDWSFTSQLDLETNKLGEELPHKMVMFMVIYASNAWISQMMCPQVEMIFTFKTVRSSFFEKSSTFRQFSKHKLFWQEVCNSIEAVLTPAPLESAAKSAIIWFSFYFFCVKVIQTLTASQGSSLKGLLCWFWLAPFRVNFFFGIFERTLYFCCQCLF